MPDALVTPDAAALYDWECRHVLHRVDQDVEFWLDLARGLGGPVLELACGTGRLTWALATAGVDIVGLDNDLVMLAAAKTRMASSEQQRAGPVFLAGDMRRFAVARRFDLVFVGYNSLQLLSWPEDMDACLSLARQHLGPRGLVGVEVTDFQSGGADGPEEGHSPLLLADAEGIRLSGTLVHDLAGRTSCYRRHFEGDGWVIDNEVVVRSLDRGELEALFHQAELTVVRSWQDGSSLRAVASRRT